MASADSSPLFSRENLAVAHAAIVVVATAWLFGGMGPHGEQISAILACPALALLFAEARARRRAGDSAGLHRLLRWSAPLAVLALLVVVSALNPSHRPAALQETIVLRPVPHIGWLPSSARPAASLLVLASLGGLAATGLALAFCVHSRRALRGLVVVLTLNALALAVLGTLQRQTGATGPYFGALASPNPSWFATFLYHNHWGAFAVLACAAGFGLVFQSLRRPPDRGWPHGPGPLLLLGTLLIAATAPLSGSRSVTVLMLILAGTATLVHLRSLLRAARHGGRGHPVLGGLALTAAVAALGLLVATQSRHVLAARLTVTSEQLASLRSDRAGYARADLYADTWRMAADAPVFGWGLDSFGVVFFNYTTNRPNSHGVLNTFEDAHSDWLQSLAEIGFVGTALLLLFAGQPLVETLRAGPGRFGPLPAWLLGGCALVAAYAWLEFPFACPGVVAAWWVLFFTALRLAWLSPAPDASSAASSRSSPS